MEGRRFTPPEVITPPISQEDALFSQSEEPLTREQYDEYWNQQKELNHMRNMQIYTGWHPKHQNYIYHGVGQKRG